MQAKKNPTEAPFWFLCGVLVYTIDHLISVPPLNLKTICSLEYTVICYSKLRGFACIGCCTFRCNLQRGRSGFRCYAAALLGADFFSGQSRKPYRCRYPHHIPPSSNPSANTDTGSKEKHNANTVNRLKILLLIAFPPENIICFAIIKFRCAIFYNVFCKE